MGCTCTTDSKVPSKCTVPKRTLLGKNENVCAVVRSYEGRQHYIGAMIQGLLFSLSLMIHGVHFTKPGNTIITSSQTGTTLNFAIFSNRLFESFAANP